MKIMLKVKFNIIMLKYIKLKYQKFCNNKYLPVEPNFLSFYVAGHLEKLDYLEEATFLPHWKICLHHEGILEQRE